MTQSKIIFIKVEDGKVDLTQEELEKLLHQAYQEGYEDGVKSQPNLITPSSPYTQPQPIPAPYIGDVPETIKPWFTCLGGNNETTDKK